MSSFRAVRLCLPLGLSSRRLFSSDIPRLQSGIQLTTTRLFKKLPTKNGHNSPFRLYSSEATSKTVREKKPSKMKELISKYGKTATVAYFGISTIDLTLTFWLVSMGGESLVKGLEDWLLENFGNWKFVKKEVEEEIIPVDEKETGAPSLTSMFLVAYSIHKLLLPIRIPITAAVTPALARKFQQLGWTIFIKKP